MLLLNNIIVEVDQVEHWSLKGFTPSATSPKYILFILAKSGINSIMHMLPRLGVTRMSNYAIYTHILEMHTIFLF